MTKLPNNTVLRMHPMMHGCVCEESVLAEVSGLCWGAWSVSPADKGEGWLWYQFWLLLAYKGKVE